MNIRFVKPVRTGESLVIEARMLERGPKQARVAAGVVSDGGEVLAEAQSHWKLMSPAVASRFTGLAEDRLEAFVASLR